jgi:flagellar biosynthesis GTPase FlhF
MSTENPTPTPSPSKSSAGQVMIYVVGAVVMFGIGLLVESQLAARTAAQVQSDHEQQMKQAADKASQAAQQAQQEKQSLTDEMAKEKADYEKALQAKDKNLASVSTHASGMRRALEADLSAARSSGDACLARVTRISEAVGQLFDSVGEVAGLAKDLGRENEQLKTDNRELSDKLAGWQKWNSDRLARIIVTDKKGSANGASQ